MVVGARGVMYASVLCVKKLCIYSMYAEVMWREPGLWERERVHIVVHLVITQLLDYISVAENEAFPKASSSMSRFSRI